MIDLARIADAVVAHLAEHPVEGWAFTYEYPGFYAWRRRAAWVSIHATPGYFAPGEIAIEIIDPTDGRQIDNGQTEDIAFTDHLTAAKYVDLMRPLLATWNMQIDR